MILRYSMTEGDAVAFCEYHVEHSETVRRQVARARYLYPIWFLGFGLLLWFVLDRPTYPIAFSALAVGWLFWWPRHWRRRYRRQALALYREGQNGNLFGEHVIESTSDGLLTRSPGGEESKYPWSLFQRIERTPEHVFLYLNAMHAVIVPRHGILDGDFDAFSQECRERAA